MIEPCKYDDPQLQVYNEAWGQDIGRAGHWFVFKNEDKVVVASAYLYVFDNFTAALFSGHVHPEYRGRGIHHKLVEARIDRAKDLGLTAVIASVHHQNFASLNNLVSEGFRFKERDGRVCNATNHFTLIKYLEDC